MSDCPRTFIAIAVPESVERKLSRLQSELAPAMPECRWTSAKPLHMTLAFLGDITNNQLSEVCRVLASSVQPFEPFEIEVAGLGAFPTTIRPRVIWAGVTALNLDKLMGLQESVATALALIGHRPDDQRFHPHVTLGRIKHGGRRQRDVTGLAQSHSDWSAGRCLIEDVRVFTSTLGPTGSVYRVLRRCGLAGKKI